MQNYDNGWPSCDVEPLRSLGNAQVYSYATFDSAGMLLACLTRFTHCHLAVGVGFALRTFVTCFAHPAEMSRRAYTLYAAVHSKQGGMTLSPSTQMTHVGMYTYYY